ncbi:hypothetical protein ABEH08_07115 [Pantoea agglomerans]|uniref:hypothetical protein n=1 Tax=Enterobacter agglomerans TaxID=549 RepID=UPI00165482E9|nr:hypothetical protein [Pantoea agglomerans]
MTVQESNQIHKKMACVQFIAEVSLIANCKPSDLKLALSIIAELANSEIHQNAGKEIFYAAD